LAVVSLAASVACLPALAQTAAGSETPQRVEITGTNIKRIDVETADPVQIVRHDDIVRSGATTVAELLQSLPSADQTSLQDVNGSNSFASGASSVSLRNLGKQSTLVLLNGRRLAPYALADFNEVFTNIDTLPLDAVDRVEILKNGASAIYGSDAVAGVINIITRKDYQGLEAGGDYSQSLNSGAFGEASIHVTAGHGDLERDRYNVLANFQYFHRDSVMWRDVLNEANPLTRENIPQGTAQFSTYSYPGNIALAPVAGCDPSMVINGLCRYDRFSRFQAQPAADRSNLLVSGHALLPNDMEAFAELLWAHTNTTYLGAYPYYGPSLAPVIWGNAQTGATETFNYFPLPPTHPLNNSGDYADFRYRFVDAGATSTTASDNYRLVTGLRGSAGKYDWESALNFLGSSTDQLQNGQLSVSGFQKEIGGTTDTSDPNSAIDPNFFNIPGGYRIGQPNSPDVLNTLFPQFGTRGKTTQVAWDGKVSGELVPLPGGPLSFATGFDLRREKFTLTPTDNLAAGDIVGYGVTQTDAARTYGAVFGELDAPITKTLDTQFAARVDKFPGFGAHVSPKAGFSFKPIKELMLRGTVEGGFRAPNLTESAQSRKTSFSNGITDPKRCAAATAYSTDLQAQSDALPDSDPNKAALAAQADQVKQQECAAGVPETTNNNPNLKPEVSRSYSLGLLFEPLKNLSLSLDYWNIQRRDEIGLKDTQEVLEQEGDLPPGITITRGSLANDPTFTTPALQQKYGVTVGAITGIANEFENVSKTKTDGLDFGVTTRVPFFSYGKLDLQLLGTYLHSFYSYSTLKNDYGDNLAGRYSYPKLSTTLSAALTTGNFVNGVKATYYSGYSLQGDYYDTDWSTQGCADNGLTADQCRVGSYSRLDYFFTYSGIKNMTFNVYLRNVFNRYPPFDYKQLFLNGGGVIPQQVEDAQRRTLKLSMNYKFW
jgi:iron complex outermembrane receptor protein